VTLIKGDLRGIIRARLLSQATMKNIKQNLFFCVCLQRAWYTDCGGGIVPFLRVAPESDDRRRSDELQFGFRSGECFAATKSANLAGACSPLQIPPSP
jgi:hypothetical protein